MRKLIKNHITNDRFFISSALAEVAGRLKGQAESMADESLTSLDKQYFSEKIGEIAKDVRAIFDYVHTINQPSLPIVSLSKMRDGLK